MFEWIFLLFTPPVPHEAAPPPPPQDYVGMVAAEAAYAALLPGDATPDKPKPGPIDPANCPTCKGTKRVPTGDSNNPWTKCPTCQPMTEPAELPKAKSTLPPGPFPKPKPSAPPPAPVKSAAALPVIPAAPSCATGACPVEKAAPSAPQGGIPFVPVPVSPWRFFRRR